MTTHITTPYSAQTIAAASRLWQVSAQTVRV
jgi:hypothetical protein